MNLLPKASGSRPRLACEVAPGGVVAGRSPEPGAPLAAVGRTELLDTAVVPGLKPGNIADRVAVIAALRRTLEQVGGRPNARNSDLTLIIPDGAVRVLLLEFDSLPNKLSEALPLVRFRLKKLVPFEPDDAMVSFQVMSTSRTLVRVLVVAVPRDVLAEYESVAREAGFEPGAVLPSTMAALAGLNEGEGASLVVNAHATGVTTAIVRAGIVLLHRSIELAELAPATPANLPPALFEPSVGALATELPLVDRDQTAPEWAAQQPLPQYGRNPYADATGAEAAVQNEDGNEMGSWSGQDSTAVDSVPVHAYPAAVYGNDPYRRAEAAPPSHSPYAAPTVSADLSAELHNAILVAPTTEGTLMDPAAGGDLHALKVYAGEEEAVPVHTLTAEVRAEEIASAVSVAVAYFEDTLGAAPQILLSAGPLGAEVLNRMLREQGVAEQDDVRARELVGAETVDAAAVTSAVPRGCLAGVVGALKS